jgi:hypothetical protein
MEPRNVDGWSPDLGHQDTRSSVALFPFVERSVKTLLVNPGMSTSKMRNGYRVGCNR